MWFLLANIDHLFMLNGKVENIVEQMCIEYEWNDVLEKLTCWIF